jgi:DNA-binding LacI/PurR family transcriptional regulator
VTKVSRVLNNPDLVVSEKQELVQRALHTLDYIPNQLARSLISRRSKAIGLVVPTISNPVFAPTIEAIERALDHAGYAVLIHCCERDPQREFKQVRALIERGVDGLILTGSVHVPELAPLLARNKLPYISQDVAADLPLGPSVALDNTGALEIAIDHLHEMGHCTIAVLTGPVHNTPPINDRFRSAIGRIKAHGLALPEEWLVIAADYRGVSVKAAAERLFALDRRPTAVACTGDILALGVVSEGAPTDCACRMTSRSWAAATPTWGNMSTRRSPRCACRLPRWGNSRSRICSRFWMDGSRPNSRCCPRVCWSGSRWRGTEFSLRLDTCERPTADFSK